MRSHSIDLSMGWSAPLGASFAGLWALIPAIIPLDLAGRAWPGTSKGSGWMTVLAVFGLPVLALVLVRARSWSGAVLSWGYDGIRVEESHCLRAFFPWSTLAVKRYAGVRHKRSGGSFPIHAIELINETTGERWVVADGEPENAASAREAIFTSTLAPLTEALADHGPPIVNINDNPQSWPALKRPSSWARYVGRASYALLLIAYIALVDQARWGLGLALVACVGLALRAQVPAAEIARSLSTFTQVPLTPEPSPYREQGFASDAEPRRWPRVRVIAIAAEFVLRVGFAAIVAIVSTAFARLGK